MKTRAMVILAGAVVAALAIFSAPANAAPILCETASLNHMNIDDSQVSSCLDAGTGNLTGNPANDLFLNGAGVGYDPAGKSDEALNNPYNISFTTTDASCSNPGDTCSGTWQFDAAFWDDFDTGAIGFKFGTGNLPDEWFVYALVTDVNSGEWEFVNVGGKGGGLSHVNLYGIPGVSVPEPATVALLGLGMIGLGFARRFRGPRA